MVYKETVRQCVKTPKQIKKKSLCVCERKNILHKTETQKPIDNLIIDENTDSNATRITDSNAVS